MIAFQVAHPQNLSLKVAEVQTEFYIQVCGLYFLCISKSQIKTNNQKEGKEEKKGEKEKKERENKPDQTKPTGQTKNLNLATAEEKDVMLEDPDCLPTTHLS